MSDINPLVEAAIKAMARAMKLRHFAIFDAGFPVSNWIEQKSFLNAEKVVKRARKDARAAFHAIDDHLGGSLCECLHATVESIDAATAAGDLTKE